MRVLVVAALCGCQRPVEDSRSAPPAPVVVVPAQMGAVSSTIQSIGTVMPVDESLVASSAAGLVEEMPVRDGQYVMKGEKLAQLREVVLTTRLEEARALLRQREQELRQYEAGYRAEEVLKTEARFKAAEASNKYAAARAERATQLREQDAISEEELHERVFEAETAAQLVAEAEAEHRRMSSGYRQEEIEAARATRDAQRHIVARLEDELVRRSIVAPFDGFVTQRYTDLGQWVEEGGPVVTLVRLDEVEVRVQVEEDAIPEIQVGQQVEVYVDAISSEPFAGEIRQIVPKANWREGSRSFPVVVRMTNSIVEGQPQLKEGMLARITFLGQSREAVLVDKDSIVRSSGRPLVFVVEDDNRVRAVEVQDGTSLGQLIEVEGEVRVGDRLVTEGAERLRPFQQVAVLNETGETTKAISETSEGRELDGAGSEEEVTVAKEQTSTSEAADSKGG